MSEGAQPSFEQFDDFDLRAELPPIDRKSGDIELVAPKRYIVAISWENVPDIVRAVANRLKEYPGSLDLSEAEEEKIDACERLQPAADWAVSRKIPCTKYILQFSKEQRAKYLEQLADHIENYLHPHPDYLDDPIANKSRTGHREYLPYVDLSKAIPEPTFLEQKINPETGEEIFTIDKWMLAEAINDFTEHSSSIYRPKKGSDLYRFYKSGGLGMFAHMNILALPDDFPLPTVSIKDNSD